eukprot:205158_1
MATNSLRAYNDYIRCPQCGRHYPTHTSATRQQYFCSSCGSDLEQKEVIPLLSTGMAPKSDNAAKYLGVTMAAILLISTFIIVYFTVINPSASNDPDHGRLISNTTAPSISPTSFTLSPTTASPTPPTLGPSLHPSRSPSISPTTANPTQSPTTDPTHNPTTNPTNSPTVNPTTDPTNSPTTDPTHSPTTDPTVKPTFNPTISPTHNPTNEPTTNPTDPPTYDPTLSPTTEPTSAHAAARKEAWTIGLSVGGGVMLLVCVAACLCCLFKAKEAEYNETVRKNTHDEEDDNYSAISDHVGGGNTCAVRME